MTFDPYKLVKFQVGMRKRLEELRAKTEESLDFAIDNVMEERQDTFFVVEEGLAEVDLSVTQIEDELSRVFDMVSAQRLESRLNFVEDRFDELDSEVRERPRRRRRKFNLADLFKAAGGGSWNPSSAQGEVSSLAEAYRILGLEFGVGLSAVTKAFRRRAKNLHPDARKGDRSAEPELRRLIEAHALIKDYLNLQNVEPPSGFEAPYTPSE
jgi:hypothetical protein